MAQPANYAKGLKMNYVEEAHVTCSTSFYGNRVPLDYMQAALKEAIDALHKLDNIKKALFYGRALTAQHAEFADDCELLPIFIGGDSKAAKNIIHGIIGAATEAGELLELLYTTIVEDKPFDTVNLDEEVGDCFWYFALLAKACNFTFTESQTKNIMKLRMRYGDKFSEYDALNRNLQAERGILELEFAKPVQHHCGQDRN